MNFQVDTPAARRLLAMTESALPQLVEEIIAICELPAPTFEEVRRTRYVQKRMADLGLSDIYVDEIGNVTGTIEGTGDGPTVLVPAHIDTVFPLQTDVTVRQSGDILRAPGVGDNSASVATMLHAARLLKERQTPLSGDVIFAATVGEEGLGNLRGIRAVMERLGSKVDYVVALDGTLGSMVRQGVGSRRLRLTVTTEGGHSWGAFGSPSAIHSLAHMIAQISEIRVPTNPKTTFNVGTIGGGTSVNTIAPHAEAVLDLRSLDISELRSLEERVRRIAQDVARYTGVQAEFTVLGDRPTGSIPISHPLCRLVKSVHQLLGIHTRIYPSSTDANIPLSMNIPAVTVGVTLGGNGHRLDEYIHTQPLAKGLAQILLILQALQKLPPGAD